MDNDVTVTSSLVLVPHNFLYYEQIIKENGAGKCVKVHVCILSCILFGPKLIPFFDRFCRFSEPEINAILEGLESEDPTRDFGSKSPSMAYCWQQGKEMDVRPGT